ncbi:hypothetical protein CB1_000091008 [Camelus ferus]|nr:hypothetical protein CB1_000091008 [Camelus ferus]
MQRPVPRSPRERELDEPTRDSHLLPQACQGSMKQQRKRPDPPGLSRHCTHSRHPLPTSAALNKNWDNRRASFYGDPVAALDSDVIEEDKRPFNESQKNH